MIKLLGKSLAVETLKEDEITKQGIILPSNVVRERERSSLNVGTVRFISPKCDMEVSVGDRVVFVEGTYWKNNERKNPDEFHLDDTTLVRVPQNEVIAVIT